MRTGEEIREYFVDLLNKMLVRAGIYGGEPVIIRIMEDLSFVEKREKEIEDLFSEMRLRGVWRSTFADGTFSNYTGSNVNSCEVGSVYAEIAFRMGYLETEKVLSKMEFKKMRTGIRKYIRSRDFTLGDILSEYGEPSWYSNGDIHKYPQYQRTLVYFCKEVPNGVITFDFTNRWMCAPLMELGLNWEYGDSSILRNIRVRGVEFCREFTFTPAGKRIKAIVDKKNADEFRRLCTRNESASSISERFSTR